MDLRRENAIINWVERTEGSRVTDYFDDNIPRSFYKSPKKKSQNEVYLSSKRYKFLQKLKEDAGCCSICSSKKSLVVDHCHFSGKLRGVLCDSCNKGLGDFKDNVKFMENAIEYLKKDYTEALDYRTLRTTV